MHALLQYGDDQPNEETPRLDKNELDFTEEIINKITEKIENVVNEKWGLCTPPTEQNRGAREPEGNPSITTRSQSPPPAKLSASSRHVNCHGPHTVLRPKVVNKEEWAGVYQRLKSFNDEKHERIKQRTEEKLKAEMMEVKLKPTISKTSEKMVRNHEDIVHRMIARKTESDKKLKQLRKQKDDAIMSKVQPAPIINPQSHSLSRPKGVMEVWTVEKNKRLKALQDKQREAEDEALKALFKPRINSKSAQLTEKRTDTNEDVVIRLTEQHRKKLNKLDEIRKQSAPSYKPTINNRSKSIKLASPVHERLYQVGMEHIVSKHKFMVDNWDFSYNLKKPLNLLAEPNPINVSSVEQDAALHTSGKFQFEQNKELNFSNINTFKNYENYNGYDEDLRYMMMDAGFFKSQYANDDTNSIVKENQ